MNLFRPEVLKGRRVRLHGDVMLTGATSGWMLTGLLVLIVTICGLWIGKGRYTRSEQVVGRIVPDGPLARIVPTRPGIITQLSVTEGQRVAAGQSLATVLVELSSADRHDPIGASLSSLDQQTELLNQQIVLAKSNGTADLAKLHASIAQANAQLAILSRQIVLQQGIVHSAKESFEPLTAVMERGYFSRLQYEIKRQQYLGAQQQLQSLHAQKAQLIDQLRSAELALQQSPVQTATRIADLRSSQASVLQKRIEVESARTYVVAAPVTGRVSSLQVTRGSSVTSQVPIMSVVGEGARLVADLYAPSRAIGFARPGQEVRLMYDAFPFQRFGSFRGTITAISRTVLAPQEVDAALPVKEPVYRIRVTLADQSVSAFGERLQLQPGMTLTANLVLDRRSFLDWLLEPVNAVRNRT